MQEKLFQVDAPVASCEAVYGDFSSAALAGGTVDGLLQALQAVLQLVQDRGDGEGTSGCI